MDANTRMIGIDGGSCTGPSAHSATFNGLQIERAGYDRRKGPNSPVLSEIVERPMIRTPTHTFHSVIMSAEDVICRSGRSHSLLFRPFLDVQRVS